MKNIFLILIAGALVFASCEKEYEVVNTETVDLAGQWWLTFETSAGTYSYYSGLTYNTAADDGSAIWVSDQGGFWDFKVKVPVQSLDDMTFGGDNLENQVDGYPIAINIRNGKVLKDAGTTISGRVVDSIYYEIWFEDAGDYGFGADEYFTVGGVAHTGFEEDDPTH